MKPYATPEIIKYYFIAIDVITTSNPNSILNSSNDNDTDTGWGENW